MEDENLKNNDAERERLLDIEQHWSSMGKENLRKCYLTCFLHIVCAYRQRPHGGVHVGKGAVQDRREAGPPARLASVRRSPLRRGRQPRTVLVFELQAASLIVNLTFDLGSQRGQERGPPVRHKGKRPRSYR